MESEDMRYIQAFLERDDKVIREIYGPYLSNVSIHLRSKGAGKDDAVDIFQDAMEVMLRKIRNDQFELRGKLYPYIKKVCEYLWYRKLRKKSINTVRDEDILELSNVEDAADFEAEAIAMERHKLLRRKIDKLTERCQKLLKLYFEKLSTKEIASRLGYKNDNVVSQQAFQCRKKLGELIEADPLYGELRV